MGYRTGNSDFLGFREDPKRFGESVLEPKKFFHLLYPQVMSIMKISVPIFSLVRESPKRFSKWATGLVLGPKFVFHLLYPQVSIMEISVPMFFISPGGSEKVQ